MTSPSSDALKSPIRPLDRDLFVCEQPLRVGGLALGVRSTLVRLAGGGLWVHSPPRLDAALRAAIEKLGPVAAIVAPSRLHHLFAPAFAAAFPEARVYAPEALAAARPELRVDETLGEAAAPLWSGEIEQCAILGQPRVDEFAFFHPSTRTLVLTDLAFNVRHSPSLFTRLFMRLNGGYQRFGPTRVLRATIRDRAALRGSVDRILGWDFERVIVAHGEVLETGGRQALRSGFAWLQ